MAQVVATWRRAAPSGGRELKPWFASLDLDPCGHVAAQARRWLEACTVRADVVPAHRAALVRVGSELARDAGSYAGRGDLVRLELDLVGPIARVSADGPAGSFRLGARAAEALATGLEWGVEHVHPDRRLVWCHLQVGS